MNLNELKIITDSKDDEPLEDCAAVSTDQRSRVYFKNLEEHLIRHIREADAVVGCVAWLTSFPIIESLASCKSGVSIVVQKEDFLRPDMASNREWAKKLRAAYDRLPDGLNRYMPGTGQLHLMSSCGDPSIQAVRCVGNHNRDKVPAFPRSHHKFVVFCDVDRTAGNETGCAGLVPHSVWTGSFNFTKNACHSFENAIYSRDLILARAFRDEWGQVCALSEELDWTSDWCEPEWRIGT
jgi:hypothetical protein